MHSVNRLQSDINAQLANSNLTTLGMVSKETNEQISTELSMGPYHRPRPNPTQPIPQSGWTESRISGKLRKRQWQRERTIGVHVMFTKVCNVNIKILVCKIIGPAAAGSAEYIPTPMQSWIIASRRKASYMHVVMYTTCVFRKSAISDPWPNPTHQSTNSRPTTNPTQPNPWVNPTHGQLWISIHTNQKLCSSSHKHSTPTVHNYWPKRLTTWPGPILFSIVGLPIEQRRW